MTLAVITTLTPDEFVWRARALPRTSFARYRMRLAPASTRQENRRVLRLRIELLVADAAGKVSKQESQVVMRAMAPSSVAERDELMVAVEAMRDMYEMAWGVKIPLQQRVFKSVGRNL